MRGSRWPIAALAAASFLVAPGHAADPKSAPETPTAAELEWLDYGDAVVRAKAENKHVVIDFYTNWCGWCKRMERTTYADSAVVAFLRKNFVLAKINAESPKRFKVGEGTMSGIELARDYQITGYPVTTFLKPDGSRVRFPVGNGKLEDKAYGYLAAPPFLRLLQLVHERKYDPGD